AQAPPRPTETRAVAQLTLTPGSERDSAPAPERIDTADERSPRPGEAREPFETPFLTIVPSDADLSSHFDAEQVDGAAVIYDPAQQRAWTHQRARAQERHLP